MSQKLNIELIHKTLEASCSEAIKDPTFCNNLTDQEIQQVADILEKLGILDNAHGTYHALESVTSCSSSLKSIVLHAFLAGYKCRIAVSEIEELQKLDIL